MRSFKASGPPDPRRAQYTTTPSGPGAFTPASTAWTVVGRGGKAVNRKEKVEAITLPGAPKPLEERISTREAVIDLVQRGETTKG